MGDPKAEHTPDAAPHATKSRFSLSLRNASTTVKDVSSPPHVLRPWEMDAATTAPQCTIGPSFPSGNPAETEKTTPTTRQTSVLKRMTFGIITPFRKHFTSGMPLP